MTRYITLNKTAKRLGLDRHRLLRLVRLGRFPARRWGRMLIVNERVLEHPGLRRYLDACWFRRLPNQQHDQDSA